MRWRFRVWDADGTNERAYDQDSAPVPAIPVFDVDTAGGCLTASWVAVAAAWDVPARAIIQIQTRATDASEWASRWKGIVVKAGNPRDPGLTQYEAVGLKQRFFEMPVVQTQLNEQDVASMARLAVTILPGSGTNAGMPAGTSEAAEDFPLLGFTTGTRYLGDTTRGALLDELEAQVGAFIVPPGEEYEYDGITFGEGDAVPRVHWGVDADGRVFFRRPPEAATSVDEADDGVLIDWSLTQAESVVDTVYLVFAGVRTSDHWVAASSRSTFRVWPPGSGSETTQIEAAAALRYRHPPLGPWDPLPGTEAAAIVKLEHPLDLMTPGTVAFGTNSDWEDEANATDGDPLTFAYLKASAYPTDPRRYLSHVDVVAADTLNTAEVTAPLLPGSSVRAPYGLWRIRYASDDPVPIVVELAEMGELTGDSRYLVFTHELPATNDDDAITSREAYVLATPNAGTVLENTSPGGRRQRLYIVGVAGTRVYELEYYTIDQDAAGRYAQAFMRAAAQDAAAVRLLGLHEPAGRVTITPRVGEPVNLPVERVEYSLTAEEGIVTTYYAGTRWEAELEAERVVLEALVKRILRSGTK